MRFCLAFLARVLAFPAAVPIVDALAVPMLLAHGTPTAELSAAERHIANEDTLLVATLVVALV